MLLAAKVTDIAAFASERSFAAWIGLTPRDHSSGGKTRTGRISRAGDDASRSVLVLGATAGIRQARRGRGHPSPRLAALLRRKAAKLAAIALANKMARIAWNLMATGQYYDPFHETRPPMVEAA